MQSLIKKGGTGKTTTTVNLGAALSKLGKKVLLIDLDSQASLSYYFGLKDFQYSVADMLWDQVPLTRTIQIVEDLSVIPANLDLTDVEVSLYKLPDRLHRLETALASVSDFDYVLLDCPPALSNITANALIAARRVIIPVQLEVLSLHGLTLMLQTIGKIAAYVQAPIDVLGLLFNNVSQHFDVYREIRDLIHQNFEVRIFNTQINHCEKIIESPSFAQSVICYSPDARGAKSFLNLARELVLITTDDRFQHITQTKTY
ncbi:MAG: ParA family protein [Bacteroidia bacterium]|nr:ParA family protein [Bacteroidia bacterium]